MKKTRGRKSRETVSLKLSILKQAYGEAVYFILPIDIQSMEPMAIFYSILYLY
jgi:hypothetical protein